MSAYLACDLGAESGRVMLGRLSGRGTTDARLTLEPVHRFPSPTFRADDGSVRWDVPAIWTGIRDGLALATRGGARPASVSVDSWGVDYVWINAGEPLLAPPFHYRDARTERTYAPTRERVGDAVIFGQTGIQFMPINTLYQLVADVRDAHPALAAASTFLTIGDYFNYRLSGVARVDQSNASTTQVYDPASRAWSDVLIEQCELPGHLFPPIVPPGTVLGPVLADVAAETGLVDVQVVATCSHDTAAAVVAVPAQGTNWAFLSSGTWSLLGVELAAPVLSERARALNFTNEAGYGGTTRFLKNIVGLWLLQESRRAWAAVGTDVSYADLTRAATDAEPFRSLIRPESPPFAVAGDMPGKIAGYCRATAQPVPETPGQVARCIFESLALLYRTTLEQLELATSQTIDRVHIVGGGSQGDLLNQFAASALDRPVFAGPVEGSAIGNVLVQAAAIGHVEPSLGAMRQIVRQSFPPQLFEPLGTGPWRDAYDRFSKLNVTP